MFSKSLFIATIVISATSHPIFAQSLEVSILEPTKTRSAEFSPGATASNYITDVSGKTVRLVGPRFYPDNARALQFPGRDSNVNSSDEAQR